MRHIAIVLAGGSGSRMQSTLPKQYLEIGGKPLLYYSLRVFENSFVDGIVLVCRPNDIEKVRKDIVEKYALSKVYAIVGGGRERFDSVYNGLKSVHTMESEKTIVYIHDGARPCLTTQILERCREDAIRCGACVAAVPVKDTIKIADENGFAVTTPNRSSLWQIQTPQVFAYELIKSAYEKMFQEDGTAGVTDDAMVVERYTDVHVHMCEAEYCNIKVTTPDDIAIVKAFLFP